MLSLSCNRIFFGCFVCGCMFVKYCDILNFPCNPNLAYCFEVERCLFCSAIYYKPGAILTCILCVCPFPAVVKCVFLFINFPLPSSFLYYSDIYSTLQYFFFWCVCSMLLSINRVWFDPILS